MGKGRTTTVTLPDGTVAKRTSQNRIYTHAVIVRDNREGAEENARFPFNWSWSHVGGTRRTNKTETEIVAALARIDEFAKGGGYDFKVYGWCSRLDLAEKQAASLRGRRFRDYDRNSGKWTRTLDGYAVGLPIFAEARVVEVDK